MVPATRGPPEILPTRATLQSLVQVTVCAGIFRQDASKIPFHNLPAGSWPDLDVRVTCGPWGTAVALA